MTAITDYNLDYECQSIARDIIYDMKEYNKDEDWARDRVHEEVDMHQWVIYHYKAHELCQNCNTDNGEDWASDCDVKPTSYDQWATTLAYGEMMVRVSIELDKLLEEIEDEEDEENKAA
jgi:hypothetical protein